MRALLVCSSCLALLAGCGDGDEVVDPPIDPPVDERVVTYEMTTTIGAGVEAEHCKFVTAPPEGMLINRDEVVYSEGSHHVLLFDSNYEEIPSTTTDGEPLPWVDEENGVFDCTLGALFTLDTRQVVAGSQNFDGASIVDLPPGVAVRIPPDAILLLNAHYINTSGDELQPSVHVDLHTIPEEELVQEGGVLFFYDIFIKAPALTTSHATMKCNVPDDITITSAQSHMHARGVDFEAVRIDPDDARETFYTNTEWADVPVERFEPGLEVAAGSRIEHSCYYDNAEAEDVFMGPRSTDEMCVLIGSYYPARADVGLCSAKADEPFVTNYMGAEWQGQGTVSCSDSLDCFNEAVNAGAGDMIATANAITECVVAADPVVSPELSAAIGCSIATFLTGGDPFTDCADAYEDCSAI